MIRRVLLMFALVTASATAALAHQLNVFAFVEDGMVNVECKFSNGNVPVFGEVRVLDAQDVILTTLSLGEDGTTAFPLDPETASEGLKIEVDTGDGHDDYWILTPADIASGSGS